MQLNKRIASTLALLSLVAVVLAGCKETKNSNQQNANQAARRSARWVAQYRVPAADLPNVNALVPFYTSISVVSRSVVFVTGDMNNPKDMSERMGIVARTTDGGATWANLPIERSGLMPEALNTIHFIDENRGWVAGLEHGGKAVVLRTVDGGASWTGAKVEVNQAPTTLFFNDENNGWMGGATAVSEDEPEGGPSSMLVTTDGGATWREQRRLSTSLSDIFFIDKMTGWATGHKGAIYHTTDGGRTWDSQKSELELPEGPYDLKSRGAQKFTVRGVDFINGQTGFAAASGNEEKAGVLIATNDGGQVWKTMWIVGDSGVFDTVLVSPTEGWASTKNGRYIFHTVDGGQSWLSEPIDFEEEVPIYRLGAADPEHVWAVGAGAVFYRVAVQ
ncbi:MAG TPA: YCF48-related protein [Blastocatellia bacterium]|nr:YCF48-related protein [Blastocatellia bacterium]